MSKFLLVILSTVLYTAFLIIYTAMMLFVVMDLWELFRFDDYIFVLDKELALGMVFIPLLVTGEYRHTKHEDDDKRLETLIGLILGSLSRPVIIFIIAHLAHFIIL